MSLIDIKNVVAPFTNKVHLVTLVLVAVLFAVYRISGGAVEVSRSGGDSNLPRPERASKAIELGESGGDQIIDPTALDHRKEIESLGIDTVIPPKSAGRTVKKQVEEQDEDLLKQMLAQQAARKAAKSQQQQRPPEGGGSGNGLDDIEKTLGLK